MRLIRESEIFLYYACNEKYEEHSFRYNVTNEKWEKLMTRSKLLLGYNENPCKKQKIGPHDSVIKSEKIANQSQLGMRISNLVEIKGIGSKTAKKLENAGVKTVSDLAKRSPKNLSEKTGVSLPQVCKWIIEANNVTEAPEVSSVEPLVIESKM